MGIGSGRSGAESERERAVKGIHILVDTLFSGVAWCFPLLRLFYTSCI
jgi:hypothetical protein